MAKYWRDRITGIVCIGLSIFFGLMALEFPAKGGTFPLFAAGGVVCLSLILIFNSFSGRWPELAEKITFDLSYNKIKPLLLIVLIAVYIPLIFEVGYFTSSIIFLIGSTLLVGIRNYFTIFLTGFILFPLMYAFFVVFLKANLPEGMFF